MKKVFIVHGLEGSPNGGWRPWLMAELEKLDIYACALPMPHPEYPSVAGWLDEIERHVRINEDDEIYLVGHSLGVPSILLFLESSEVKIKGAVLVSGPLELTNNEKVNPFLENGFDFDKIKSHTKKFAVIHGDDDPLVPLSDAKNLASNLNCHLEIIPNGGHLNGSSGWTSLPEVLTLLVNMME